MHINYTLVILLILFVLIYRLNLCRKNAKETTELCHKIKNLYSTYLSNGTPEFHDVASNTLNALWYVDMTADIDAFMAFAYKIHGLPGKYSTDFTLIRNFYFNNFYLLFFYN